MSGSFPFIYEDKNNARGMIENGEDPISSNTSF